MSFLSLKASNFRNLDCNNRLEFSPHLNVIHGNNGSGKTSLLEALYILATAKSFRTRKLSSFISDNGAVRDTVIYGKLLSKQNETLTVGVRKSIESGTEIKINGHAEKTSSKLARNIPVLVIEPGSFSLLEGGPKTRRQFVDWGVFHVEHMFSESWIRYVHCLKQRNTVLKTNTKFELLDVWDKQLIEYGQQITALRESYITELNQSLSIILNEIYPELDEHLEFKFYKGWDKRSSFEECLSLNRKQDQLRKFTQYGPHRADFKLLINGKNAVEILSRGQQKKLITSLYLAQSLTVKEKSGYKSVVLFDDISSELDVRNTKKVLKYLVKLDSQVFCTLLETESLKDLFESEVKDFSMFHVEHGRITRIEKEDFSQKVPS